MTDECLDVTDWSLLVELQGNARTSVAELARRASMSSSAITERIRRLEERGVVSGYTAQLDHEKLGLNVHAFVRLRYLTSNYKPFHDLLDTTPEIIEAHHITGEDCFLLEVYARNMRHLEAVAGRIAGLGSVTTTVVYSTPLTRRHLTAANLGNPST